MLRTLLLFPLLALVLHAEVQVPQMGSVRCADGSVRAVYGVPASFVLGKPLLLSAVSSSFSAGAGIVATRDAIQLLDPSGGPLALSPSPDPEALVDIGKDAFSAVAWLPGTSSLLYWDGNGFRRTEIPAPPAGRIVGVRRSASSAVLLVLEDGAASEHEISLSSGYLLSTRLLNDVAGPALKVGEFLVSTGQAEIEIDGPGGRRSISVPAANLALERMASDWIHVFSARSTRHWALQLDQGTVQLFELPAASPQEIVR